MTMPLTHDGRISTPDDTPTTLPAWLRFQAQQRPTETAIREKRLGRWREIDWAEYWNLAATVGAALTELGVAAGDRVAIHSENRPEWVYADIGAQGIGAIPFGIYPTNPAAEVGFLLEHSGARVLIAEDQEQVDKVIEAGDACPSVERIIVIDRRGVTDYDDERLMWWEDFLALGTAALEQHPLLFNDEVDRRVPSEVATIVYTSGTTGQPKAAMLSAHLMVEDGQAALGALGMTRSDEVLSYLPLCHLAEKVYTLFIPLQLGCVVNFAESIEAVQQNLVEIQPSVFLGVPRIWQKMRANIESRANDTDWLKRANFRLWLRVARWRGSVRVANRGQDTLATRIVGGIGHWMLYRPLKAKLGMLRCRQAVSGSAPISQETLEFFLGIGVPICEAYGLTEAATVSWTLSDDVRVGTVGPPVPSMDVKIADDGEILVKGPLVFSGYFRDEEATKQSFTDDGWLMTGDIGELADGHLRITDRKKDVMITAGGKNITPTVIENRLRASPLVKEAIVIGDGRKYVSALIGIEGEVAGDWAQRNDVAYTTYRDLTEQPEILELVAEVVREANTELARVEQVKSYRLLPKELDEDDSEVTATQKVKRRVIAERFADLIEGMYEETS
ncbi:AMP-dependent synthetase/ligase [Ilumatobacter coccineus]|uniref:Acyl-CoA synthetase n=1 Tax=Ilumatobacter coccineus (strain NBRC 103263 / KCTC 29153 / YM16-304) TaxID=1313172 RepID=A0A6C7E269_ILUCY|nr:AMP-binding protein [Ilumatobacter coccineus]BAN00931.1 putative long-chain-fatty-acid--CoA ligase [Ilumatobacter coccineus YM16-304]